MTDSLQEPLNSGKVGAQVNSYIRPPQHRCMVGFRKSTKNPRALKIYIHLCFGWEEVKSLTQTLKEMWKSQNPNS